MSAATDVIARVARETDSALLFHSATGKDSLVMLDLMAPYFRQIVCVYMYMTPNLRSVNKYIKWSECRYPNARFIQCPHFNLTSWVKTGYLGITQNTRQPLLNLAKITDKARECTGIEWAFYGMKEADSLNRRIMLRTYDDGICWKSKKAYPLHLYKTKDMVRYIKEHNILPNATYGAQGMSSGENPASWSYLLWLRENYPDDLDRVFAMFPDCRRILFEYDEMVAGEQADIEGE